MKTLLNDDFKEMLSALSDEKVDYLLVGAFALAFHGITRATGDIDIWLRCTPGNASRTWSALRRFGAPLGGLKKADLQQQGMTVQIGVTPVRIDLLTSIDGVVFEEAWPRRKILQVGRIRVPVISRIDLVANKRATGRPQDLVDLESLRKLEAEEEG